MVADESCVIFDYLENRNDHDLSPLEISILLIVQARASFNSYYSVLYTAIRKYK